MVLIGPISHAGTEWPKSSLRVGAKNYAFRSDQTQILGNAYEEFRVLIIIIKNISRVS
jgi:hypothetical protein